MGATVRIKLQNKVVQKNKVEIGQETSKTQMKSEGQSKAKVRLKVRNSFLVPTWNLRLSHSCRFVSYRPLSAQPLIGDHEQSHLLTKSTNRL